MVLKHVAKIVVAFGEAVGKAFTRAVREEYTAAKNSAQNQSTSSQNTKSATEDATRTNARLGISLQESIQILDVKQPINREELENRYKHLFDINDKSKGGTLYLQSKIYRAKERIDKELSRIDSEKQDEEPSNEERNLSEGVLSVYESVRSQPSSTHKFAHPVNEVCERLILMLLNNDESPSNAEPICSEGFTRAVWSVFVDAARRNIDPDAFTNIIDGSCDVGKAIVEAIVNNNPKHGNALRDVEKTIGWEYPKVVGIDWSVLSVVESNENVEIEEPLTEISFKVLPTGETDSKNFRFLCNKNQLMIRTENTYFSDYVAFTKNFL